MPLTRNTPAKINLFLDVRGVRADGYHEIETLFLPLDSPSDTITISERPQQGLSLQCSDPSVPQGEANLCWQAATRFAHATGREPHWHILIDKRIPAAAGLGGGSSDAGAVLRLLNEAPGNPLPPDQLLALASDLGADVPYFLDPVPAQATGIGEKLRPLPACPSLPIVLIAPRFPVPSSWAYAHLDRVPRPAPPPLQRLLQALAERDLDTVGARTYNALGFAVCDKFPIVDMMLESLRDAGCAAALVSGSGPTVFGLCRIEDRHRIAEAARTRFGPSIQVFETATTE